MGIMQLTGCFLLKQITCLFRPNITVKDDWTLKPITYLPASVSTFSILKNFAENETVEQQDRMYRKQTHHFKYCDAILKTFAN